MSEKELIQKLLEENKKLKAKLKPKKSYVLENRDQFETLIQDLQKFKNGKSLRYFFERKNQKGDGVELVFKLNTLVTDLIEFKARANVDDDKVNSRISMDKGSLIKVLSEGRVKRPRGGDGIDTKPKGKKATEKTKTADSIAKGIEDLKATKQLIEKKIKEVRETPPAPATLPGFDPERMDKTIQR